MEYKITEQTVAVNELIFDECVEQPIDTEFTLPDYCPDISRILKCRVTPLINSKTVAGAGLTVDGTANIHALYCDGGGEIRSYEHSVSFSRSVELGGGADNAMVSVKCKTDYMNCRAVTERRFDVHGALSVYIKVYSRNNTGVVVDVDGDGVQMQKELIPVTNTTGWAEKYLALTDELEVGQGKQAIRSILRSDARAVCSECKIISNKVIVKGELLLTTLYCGDEDGLPERLENAIPISQIVDIEGVTEGCSGTVNMDIVGLEVKPRTGSAGEARSVNVSVRARIDVKAHCHTEIPLISDAYSTRFEISAVKSDVVTERLIEDIRENYLCKKALELPPGSVSEVVDLWCDSYVSSVRSEADTLIIYGTVLICLLARDGEGSVQYYERPVEYEYRHALPQAPKEMRCEPVVAAVAASYTILSGSELEARVELSVSAEALDVARINAVTSLTVDEAKPKAAPDAALIVYYANGGETV
ncbi:MAG: DUF3794 domain-containing protein, partial [Oscillospiraceae bacterium]|nr:DUF3794 domain-containing protein [Oscillospiraceae bacterium]